jgi:hypothetical protein
MRAEPCTEDNETHGIVTLIHVSVVVLPQENVGLVIQPNNTTGVISPSNCNTGGFLVGRSLSATSPRRVPLWSEADTLDRTNSYHCGLDQKRTSREPLGGLGLARDSGIRLSARLLFTVFRSLQH